MVLYIEGKRVPAVKDEPVGATEAIQASAESAVSQSPSAPRLAGSTSRSKARRAPIQKRPKLEAVPAADAPVSARKKVKSKVSGKRRSSRADKVTKPGEALSADDEVNEKKIGEGGVSPDRAQHDIPAGVLRLAFEKLLAHPEIQAVLGQAGAEGASVSGVIEHILTEVLGEAAMKRAAAQQELLNKINLNAAGLDIGAEEIWVGVPDGRDEKAVRMFKTFTPDLYALADWLKQCRIDTVAMESTGVYWIPIYEILEAQGVKVYLVNARHIKNVSGRKTDVLDCQWIQALHTYGLLQASFRPAEDICTLRAYVRHRDNLVRYRAAHIQHMQKAMTQMNVLLTNVVKDITGKTGMAIIRSIVAGERDPETLAQFRDPRCAKSQAEIAKALTGNYRNEHVFALKQALECYDFYTQQIQTCDAEIEHWYLTREPVVDEAAQPLTPLPKSKPPAHAPEYDLRTYLYRSTGVDLTAVDGLEVVLIQEIISEIGLDMSKWPTDKHFTSWLKIAPYNDISGGKVLRRKTGKSTNPAARAFRMAAQAVSRTDTALGAFYRRMRAKHGGPKAIVATACKIARIVYHMLKDKTEYLDQGADYYEEKYRQQVVKNLERKAAKLGFKIVPVEA
jgi:transposase